jgi:hypothetical protein
MPECNLIFNFTEKIPSPSYIYYELENFYMNHRDFVNSKIFPQLRGEIEISSNNNSKCMGARYMKDIYNHVNSNKTYHIEKLKMGRENDLNPDDFSIPCGLIAKAYFNDEYQLYKKNSSLINSNDNQNANNRINIDEKGIANDYDINYMFKNFENWKSKQWLDITNGEKFIIFYFIL